MKNIVEYIDGFLKKKNIEWLNKKIFNVREETHVKAIDEDFENNEMQCVCFKISAYNLVNKQILVTENLFLIFNALGNKLEKDFKTVRYYQINTIDDVELINHHKSVNKELLFNKTKKALYTSTQGEYIEDKKLDVLGKVHDYKVIDGNLYLYSIDNIVNIKIVLKKGKNYDR